MDFFSHLFWTLIVFHNQGPLWLPLLFGAIPDISSWGILFIHLLAKGKLKSTFMKRDWKHPDFSDLPKWIWTLYGATHSIFSFAAIFAILSLATGNIFVPALAWGMHILFDLPTHSREVLGTPFLWPVSDWKFPGFSWGRLWFVLLNYGAIITLIIYLFIVKGGTLVLF